MKDPGLSLVELVRTIRDAPRAVLETYEWELAEMICNDPKLSAKNMFLQLFDVGLSVAHAAWAVRSLRRINL